MKNNNLIRFARSLVFLPIMTMSLSLGSIGSIHNSQAPQNVLAQKLNIEANGVVAFNQAAAPKAESKDLTLARKAEAIDAYFKSRNLPLEGTGLKMAAEAEKNDIDWRLLPAIAMRESTGGKFACKKVPNNPFGWGSCKIGFKSNDAAIETVAKNLGGNNPNTARHYADKTTKEILNAYNPPSIIPHYTAQVISIMEDIGEEEKEIKITT